MSRQHRSFFNDLADSWHNKTPADHLLKSMHHFGVAPDDCVLDVGAGTGVLTAPLASIIDSGRIFAVDVSEKMLAAARNNVAVKHVNYFCADACQLSFSKNVFDKIVCYSTFPHIHKPNCALAEFFRVLKPGGRILIFHNCCSRKLNQYHARMTHVVSFDKLPKSEYLQILMQQAGFSHIKTVEQPDLYWVEAKKEKND